MKAHIVLAHKTTLTDLYATGFDPCEGPTHFGSRHDTELFHTQTEQRYNAENQSLAPEVNAEMQHLHDCDLLVVHFPLWWFGPPAILKGWMDRVFVYGHMYTLNTTPMMISTNKNDCVPMHQFIRRLSGILQLSLLLVVANLDHNQDNSEMTTIFSRQLTFAGKLCPAGNSPMQKYGTCTRTSAYLFRV